MASTPSRTSSTDTVSTLIGSVYAESLVKDAQHHFLARQTSSSTSSINWSRPLKFELEKSVSDGHAPLFNEIEVRVTPRCSHESTAHHGRPRKMSVAEDNMDSSVVPRFFINPWDSWQTISLSDIRTSLRKGAIICKNLAKHGDENLEHGGRLVKVLKPDFEAASQKGNGEQVCWLGHASVLVQIPWSASQRGSAISHRTSDMCGVLFDPVFSKRCSPSQHFGPARSLEVPCTVEELPPIHVVCISHDHYDHLDANTIKDLWRLNQQWIRFFVPLGVKKWFLALKIPSSAVIELDWFQHATIRFPSPANLDFRPSRQNNIRSTISSSSTLVDLPAHPVLELRATCTPAQHRSGRGLFDQMRTLWCSWVVEVVKEEGGEKTSIAEGRGGDEEAFKVFFAGDTGYRYAGAPETEADRMICPAFKQIASRFAPITLSLLPISTGSCLSFLRPLLGISLHHYSLTSSMHLNARDALEIAGMMEGRAVGIHHSTFATEEEARGCVMDFEETRRARGISGDWDDEGCFVVCDIGEILTL